MCHVPRLMPREVTQPISLEEKVDVVNVGYIMVTRNHIERVGFLLARP